MTPDDYLEAARVPASVAPQTFGLWTIVRRDTSHPDLEARVGWPSRTELYRVSGRTLHLIGPGELVMEDSRRELSKHLPIWMVARGRVLVTGLGLGCVVRGLLSNPDVDHIDVVEIDPQILRIVGREFVGNARVSLHLGDALTLDFPAGSRWDYGWHDLWCDGGQHLQCLHLKLFIPSSIRGA